MSASIYSERSYAEREADSVRSSGDVRRSRTVRSIRDVQFCGRSRAGTGDGGEVLGVHVVDDGGWERAPVIERDSVDGLVDGLVERLGLGEMVDVDLR